MMLLTASTSFSSQRRNGRAVNDNAASFSSQRRNGRAVNDNMERVCPVAIAAAGRHPGRSNKVHKAATQAQVSVVKGVVGIVVSLGIGQKSAAKQSVTANDVARRLTLCRLKKRTTRC